MLKLASLGMFSFSLGQTMLCIGRNETSCESYGYDACDYQVAGGSIRAVPSVHLPKAPHFDLPAPLIYLSLSRSHLCGRLWAEPPIPQLTSRGRHSHHAVRRAGGSPGCWVSLLQSYPQGLGFNLAIISDSGQGSCTPETPSPMGG